MADKKIDKALDSLFADVDKLINSLGKQFSVEDFREKLAQQKQDEYAELVKLCEGKANTFAVAHQHIRRRLNDEAKRLGYKVSGEKETKLDTFGNSQQYDIFIKD